MAMNHIHEQVPFPLALCAIAADHIMYVQEFDASALSNCLWAFAQLRHHPGDALLDAAALHICCCIDAFPAQVLAACCLLLIEGLPACLSEHKLMYLADLHSFFGGYHQGDLTTRQHPSKES